MAESKYRSALLLTGSCKKESQLEGSQTWEQQSDWQVVANKAIIKRSPPWEKELL